MTTLEGSMEAVRKAGHWSSRQELTYDLQAQGRAKES